ncbi:MAG: signal recognition particle-docking protein FtsY [Bdellovibrionota bacterium]
MENLIPPVHQNALEGLLIFIGVLALAIVFPFIMKAFRKGTPKENFEDKSKPHQIPGHNKDVRASENSISIFPRGSVVDIDPHPEPQEFRIQRSLEIKEDHPDSEKAAHSATFKPDTKTKADVKTEFTLANALKNTQAQIFGRITQLWKKDSSLDENIDTLEEVLYTSDLGPKTVESLLESLRHDLRKMSNPTLENLESSLKIHLMEFFDPVRATDLQMDVVARLKKPTDGPCVMMIVGINGAGKTTTIGKLSSHLAQKGFKVLVAAGDTFRAAAGEQLRVWTDRAQVEIFAPVGVMDPSGVAFDAVAKGKAQGYDYIIIDTAGRLHTQAHLMEELKKVKRVIQKQMPEAPHECLLVVDSNSGQNALLQGVEFNQALGLTGIVMTKLDGTAKGGVAVGLVHELQIPIKFIGTGEKIQDLRIFHHQDFVESLFAQKS